MRFKRRLTIPAAGVQGLVQRLHHCEPARDALWLQGQSAEGSTERSHWRLLWKRGRLKSAQANDWVQLALTQLGCVPP